MNYRKMLVPAALVVVWAAVGGAVDAQAEERPHPLVGTWVANWGKGIREEIRVDAVSAYASISGVFCGVRSRDGSIFFFDFSIARPKFDGSELSLKRGKSGKHTYRFEAVSDGSGVEYTYRQKGRKAYRTVMVPAAEGDVSQCADRIRSRSDGRLSIKTMDEPSVANDSPFTGVWTGINDIDMVVEMRAGLLRGGQLAGTLCFGRRDRSMVFFDFAPDQGIEAVASSNGFEIERRPFKAKMTHRLDVADLFGVRYRERVQRKPWRTNIVLAPGASEAGCLRRIAQPRTP